MGFYTKFFLVFLLSAYYLVSSTTVSAQSEAEHLSHHPELAGQGGPPFSATCCPIIANAWRSSWRRPRRNDGRDG